MKLAGRFLRAVKVYVSAHHGWRSAIRDICRMSLEMLCQQGGAGLYRAFRDHVHFSNEPIAFAPTVGQDAVTVRAAVRPHDARIDIIVCVHNAYQDVVRCLESVVACSTAPYSLVIIDDGSDEPTRTYLDRFATDHFALLLRNAAPLGYTLAANQGLRSSQGDWALLLNSDTVVTKGWLDRMVACADTDPAIGLVGPLSNTASWQSIPHLEEDGDWAANPLPAGWTVADMGQLVASHSARVYPRITFLNGFCLMIRRQVLGEVGYFDEDAFGKGYGEENDYCLRARAAGWMLAVADDTYIWHAQSKSYSDDRRRQLVAVAGEALAAKYGHRLIADGVRFCREDRVLHGIRARAAMLPEKGRLAEEGRRRWQGRKVAFILPVADAGGGGNVIINEAREMAKMGVAVTLVNLLRCREGFEREIPSLGLPVIYVPSPTAVPDVCMGFDAVVATVNFTMEWIVPLKRLAPASVLGYYVQDYEPLFYADGSPEQHRALASYALVPDLVRVTSSLWNAVAVREGTGVDCIVVGPSYADELFLPRMRSEPSWPERPVRIAAMIRPASPRRNARFTMEVLRAVRARCCEEIDIVLFGVSSDDPEFLALPRDFAFRNLGRQRPEELAELFNTTDVFADFSTYQALGITAMEAMASGAAVIVPRCGGADSFAVHERNALVVDTSSFDACSRALSLLVTDHHLRARLQREAIASIPQFFPAGPAFLTLEALFGAES